MIRALVIAAALSTMAPAVSAQTAPATPAEAPSPGEAAFEATAEAFGAKVEAMQAEMQTAAAEADAARRAASLDAIEARYQPDADADAFATAFEVFMNQQMAAAPETERPGMLAGLTQALPQLRSVPRLVRTQIEQAATAAPAP
ncbi:translation initiation factor IF-2 [Brevundimonas sp. SL161]|uniref:translation initiation factor IF-2 n=1 Tax=Brevundimonas sp. SL161 TaxID=2804613 RepID=UPI003CEDCEC2